MAKPTNKGITPKPLDHNTATRGSSIQGERQAAKGGPAGANQGGASRGGSRAEPSHVSDARKQNESKRPPKSRRT